MRILIKNGRVIDPQNQIDGKRDILIKEGKIALVKQHISPGLARNAKIIEAEGKLVVPGLIDLHTHLREPGHEEEETIATGTRAAARGGFTTICCMPNTHPVMDNQTTVEFVLLKAKEEGIINVLPVGSITKGSLGQEITEIGELKETGVVAISDDGEPVMNALIMRRAFEYAKMFDLPVISHCEDQNLSQNGVINEGYISTVLGLKGIPREAEEVMVARDIILAELTGGHLHIAHVSSAGSVELIRSAKKRKIKLTAETCPHYFTLTDEAVVGYNPNSKMNPPLRTREDLEEIKKGLKDGTIDCLATDHAPHTEEEKNKEYDLSPFGIIGLETLVPLVFTELVHPKVLTITEAVEKLTVNPARVIGINKGTLSVGAEADITVIDPELELEITTDFCSKSKNSPFIGRTLKGFPVTTIVEGRVVMEDRKILL